MGKATNPKTQQTWMRIEQLHGKEALLASWEQQPEDILIREHDYLLELRKQIRQIRNYIVNRKDPNADLVRTYDTND